MWRIIHWLALSVSFLSPSIPFSPSHSPSFPFSFFLSNILFSHSLSLFLSDHLSLNISILTSTKLNTHRRWPQCLYVKNVIALQNLSLRHLSCWTQSRTLCHRVLQHIKANKHLQKCQISSISQADSFLFQCAHKFVQLLDCLRYTICWRGTVLK